MDKNILLVNLKYTPKEDDDHIIYQINNKDTEQAKKAIEKAYRQWQTAETGSIEDFIENEFKRNNIHVEHITYDNINLDIETY